MKNDIQKRDETHEIFEAEYTEHEKYIDRISPNIQQHSQLVDDKKGNRLLWMAIFAGAISLLIFLLSFF